MYVVRGYRLANYLLAKNLSLSKIDRDKNNKSRILFLFRDSTQLRNAITEFTKNLGK